MEVMNWTAYGTPEKPGRIWTVRFRPDDSQISQGMGGLLQLWWAPSLAEIDQVRF